MRLGKDAQDDVRVQLEKRRKIPKFVRKLLQHVHRVHLHGLFERFGPMTGKERRCPY